MTVRRLLFASAIVLLAVPAFAGITLLAPRTGDRLEGGSDATLKWAADVLPPDAAEWEAFLSVNGGGYYAVRITPHLDADIRSFTWHVPNIATTRARLMLRIGDETHERIIALPETFTIEATSAPIEPSFAESEAGESATPGSEPAIEWVSADLVTHRRAHAAVSGEPSIAPMRGVDAAVTPAHAPRLAGRVANTQLLSRDAQQRAQPAIVLRPLLLLAMRLNI